MLVPEYLRCESGAKCSLEPLRAVIEGVCVQDTHATFMFMYESMCHCTRIKSFQPFSPPDAKNRS